MNDDIKTLGELLGPLYDGPAEAKLEPHSIIQGSPYKGSQYPGKTYGLLGHRALFSLPGSTVRLGGCLYCVEFSSETAKVGFTTNVQARVRQHVSHASTFGLRASRVWASPPTKEFKELEKQLIAKLRLDFEKLGRESFRGSGILEATENWWMGHTRIWPPGEFLHEQIRRLERAVT